MAKVQDESTLPESRNASKEGDSAVEDGDEGVVGAVIKPRSLVFDLFGDYLRYRGGEVRLRHLSAVLRFFDIPESTVRVVVGRLRRDGWLVSRREGRETVYALTDAAWRLLDEGRDRIFRRADEAWSGEWQMIIYSVPETERAMRDQLRKRLAWWGFGSLSPSVWISPHDRAAAIAEAFPADGPVRIDVFRSRSDNGTSDVELVGRAWDLDELGRDYRAWLERWEPVARRCRREPPEGSEALVLRMRLVRDYRGFPFRDPDLPAELVPDDWPGRRAFQLFIDLHDLLQASAEAALGAVLAD